MVVLRHMHAHSYTHTHTHTRTHSDTVDLNTCHLGAISAGHCSGKVEVMADVSKVKSWSICTCNMLYLLHP